MTTERFNLLIKYTVDLDKAYNSYTYDSLLNTVKRKGFKVFRNPEGKHKLKEDPSWTPQKEAVSDLFGDLFGGAFKF